MRVLNAHVYPGIAALLCGQKYFYPVGRYYMASWLFKDILLFSCCVHLHGGELRGTSLLLLLLPLFFFFFLASYSHRWFRALDFLKRDSPLIKECLKSVLPQERCSAAVVLQLLVFRAHSLLGQKTLKYRWIIWANDVYCPSDLIPSAVMEDITEYSWLAC